MNITPSTSSETSRVVRTRLLLRPLRRFLPQSGRMRTTQTCLYTCPSRPKPHRTCPPTQTRTPTRRLLTDRPFCALHATQATLGWSTCAATSAATPISVHLPVSVERASRAVTFLRATRPNAVSCSLENPRHLLTARLSDVRVPRALRAHAPLRSQRASRTATRWPICRSTLPCQMQSTCRCSHHRR